MLTLSTKNQPKTKKTTFSERIENDFLTYVAYALVAAIALAFLYNAACFRYGDSVGRAMPSVFWLLTAAFAVIFAIFVILWRIKGFRGFKISAIYSLITAVGFLWCAGAGVGANALKNIFPFIKPLVSQERDIRLLFYVIGISFPVMVIIYIVRMVRLKNKNK